MWLANDAFQFVWKKMSGDVTLTATSPFSARSERASQGGADDPPNSRRGFSLCGRALHGSGLTSLQYREEEGAATHEIRPTFPRPSGCGLKAARVFFDVARDEKGDFIRRAAPRESRSRAVLRWAWRLQPR